MYKLKKSDYYKVKDILKRPTEFHLELKVLLEGYRNDEIYVDNLQTPESVYVNMGYIQFVAGKSDNALFNKNLKNTIGFYNPISCDSDEWELKLNEIHPNKYMLNIKWLFFELKDQPSSNFNYTLPENIFLEKINKELLSQHNLQNINSVSSIITHNNITDRIEKGTFGYCVRNKEKILSWSLFYSSIEDRVELSIDTDNDSRGKGLGTIAASACVDLCFKMGMKVEWICYENNFPSVKIAEKIGFQKKVTYIRHYPWLNFDNSYCLKTKQLMEYASFFEKASEKDPRCYLPAMVIWAGLDNFDKTIDSAKQYLATGIYDKHHFEKFCTDKHIKKFDPKKEWQNLLR